MESLSLCSTQVVTVLIIFDAVLAMLLSIRTKYETIKVNCYFIFNDSAQRTYIYFLASFLQPNLRN